MKKCNKCGEIKNASNFSIKSKAKDGLQGSCKLCMSEYKKNHYNKNRGTIIRRLYIKNKEYREKRKHNIYILLSRMYGQMKCRVNGSGGDIGGAYKKKICSRDEFFKYANKNAELIQLIKYWKENDFDKLFIPSVDRWDNKKGYTIDNIQFMTFIDNMKKQ